MKYVVDWLHEIHPLNCGCMYYIYTLCQIEDGSGHFEPLVSIGDLQSVQQSHDIHPLLLQTQLHPPPALHWAEYRRIIPLSMLIISVILLRPPILVRFWHVRKISQDLCCSNTHERGSIHENTASLQWPLFSFRQKFYSTTYTSGGLNANYCTNLPLNIGKTFAICFESLCSRFLL